MTTEDLETFLQEMRDYFGIEQQRHQSIMAILTDVQTNNSAIKTAAETLAAEVKTMLADLAATGAAGHSAVLDSIVADQANALTAVSAAGTEIKAAIAAVQLPGAPAK